MNKVLLQKSSAMSFALAPVHKQRSTNRDLNLRSTCRVLEGCGVMHDPGSGTGSMHNVHPVHQLHCNARVRSKDNDLVSVNWIK